MSPEQQIDFVFLFLKDKFQYGTQYSKDYAWSTYVSASPEVGINKLMYDEIIRLLIEEGYVREVILDQPFLHITMKGLIFVGYNRTKEALDANEKELGRIRNLQIQQSSQMSFLTMLVAVGTLVAAVYYCLAIQKDYSYFGNFLSFFVGIVTGVFLHKFLLKDRS